MPPDDSTARAAGHVVVPIRSFANAKARLAGRLDRDERAALARRLATNVVSAASGYSVTIVTSAPEVEAWAVEVECTVVADPGTLDAAARDGYAAATAQGARRIVVAHGDLPLVTSFRALFGVDSDAALIVGDRHGDGTPVISLPAAVDFHFSYGPGSLARHLAEAERLGLRAVLVEDPVLGFDIDVPADLDALETITSRR